MYWSKGSNKKRKLGKGIGRRGPRKQGKCTGEGIKEEHIPRLFERFFRVDKSGSRKVGGSGLGLSIVKHIVEAHNEKIYVESQFEVGSEFSFTLEKTK